MDQSFELNNERSLLHSRLTQREDKIQTWLKDETKIEKALADKHAEVMKKRKDEMSKLNTTNARKQQQAADKSQELEQHCKRLESLKAELLKLRNYSDELKIHQKQFENEGEYILKEIDGLKSCIESQSKTREKLMYLNKACGSFEGVLGLSFKKTKGNRMQIIFTNIDEKDPSMQFYFFLQVEEGSRKYIVTDPEPALSGLQELVEKLNSTNNIRAFMIDIRQKFKETLKL